MTLEYNLQNVNQDAGLRPALSVKPMLKDSSEEDNNEVIIV